MGLCNAIHVVVRLVLLFQVPVWVRGICRIVWRRALVHVVFARFCRSSRCSSSCNNTILVVMGCLLEMVLGAVVSIVLWLLRRVCIHSCC